MDVVGAFDEDFPRHILAVFLSREVELTDEFFNYFKFYRRRGCKRNRTFSTSCVLPLVARLLILKLT